MTAFSSADVVTLFVPERMMVALPSHIMAGPSVTLMVAPSSVNVFPAGTKTVADLLPDTGGILTATGMLRYVEFSVSADGVNSTPVGRLDNTVDETDMTIQVWDAELPVNCTARYVKIFAKNIGTIPSWHPGAGAPGFIFTDEVWAR